MSFIPEESVELKDFNWWKVGGVAQYYTAPTTVEEVGQAMEWAHKNKQEMHVLSGGSNSLVKDGLIEGLTIHLHKLNEVENVDDEGDIIYISTLAGTPKSELAKVFLQKKRAPAVFLTGIPGDVGGGIVMNAGVGEDRKPREFCEIVEWVEVMRLNDKGKAESHEMANENLDWTYRGCKGWQPGVIVRVGIVWEGTSEDSVMNDVREATKKRVSTQPLNEASCGSVFRNPPGLKSAKLIEECGLKGHRIGGVSVSEKHANFIVNDQDGTAADIRELILHVQAEVKKQKQVDLVPEVCFFGGWSLA